MAIAIAEDREKEGGDEMDIKENKKETHARNENQRIVECIGENEISNIDAIGEERKGNKNKEGDDSFPIEAASLFHGRGEEKTEKQVECFQTHVEEIFDCDIHQLYFPR